MMNKFHTIFVSFVLLLLLCGCEQPPSNDPEKVEDDVIILRFGHHSPEDSPLHTAVVKFADEVNEKSNGQLQISIFPGQVLGTDRQMLGMAQLGELDIIIPTAAKLSHIIPELQVFSLPFLFPDEKTIQKVFDGTAGSLLLASFEEHDLVGLTFFGSGFKQLTSNKPLVKADDFKGTRFRIMESGLIREQFSAWGADATMIDFGKTYDALKNNIADGQENPLSAIVNMKFHEVQKHLYMSNHGYGALVLAMSQLTFNKLSKNHQDIIFESALATNSFQREKSQKQNTQLLKYLQTQSIQVTELSAEMKQTLRNKSRHLIEKYRATFGTELVEQILQTVDDDKTFHENELVIALDADMAGNSSLSGLAIKRGIELAIDEVNAQGGVLGKSLVLTARDNSMIPARGQANLKRFSSIPNLIAVFGGISSPVVMSELEYIHQQKLLFLAPWAAATPIIDNGYEPNYVFRLSVRDEYAAGFLLKHALQISPKVGLLLVNNGWGRSNHKALVSALSKDNLQAKQVEWFEWGEANFIDSIQKLYDAGTEVIIFVGNPVEAAKMLKVISKQEQPIAVISHWGITGGEFPVLAGDALDKVDLRVLQTFSFIDNKASNVEALVKQYKAKYFISKTEDIVAPVGTAHAYDLTHLLVKAIKQANSTDMEKIKSALESIKYHQGLVKNYKPPFTKQDHDALDREDFILTHYKNNHLVTFRANEIKKQK
ncbi:MAG: C4-dicarboxylate-binding protein DctP [Enterobacterales bacterium]|jgi:C4-dicarboxylate-binding protein DctP